MNETKNITKDSENIGKSKRIFYYDVLRALAIIGIVLCHVSVSYVSRDINSPNLYISVFFDCFRDFSIPIFVMLSGALLINGLVPATGPTLKKNPTTRAAVVVDGPTLEKGDITIDCAGVFDFNDEGEIFNTSDIFIAVPVEKGGEIEPTNLILTLQTSDPEGPHAYFNIGKVTDGSFTYSTVNESGKLYNLKDYLVYSGGGRM